jgi:carbon monoxide dehydrogenase subunit G
MIWQSSEARLPQVFNRTYDHSAQETEMKADWNRFVYVQSHSGCTRMQSLAGANNRHQIVEEGREVVVERRAKLGAEPSNTGSVFVL